MSLFYASSGLCGLLGLALVYVLGRRLTRLPLPPGPPTLPLLGNALQMPSDREWLQFADWAKIYGKIVHLSVFGSSIILLNKPDAIADLLEKRSAIYSDRPNFPMAGEIVGYNQYIVLERYGNRLREGRKVILSNINARKLHEIQQVQKSKAIQLLSKLLDSPFRFRQHVRWYVAAVVFQISHGHDVENFEDPFVQIAEEASLDFSLLARPGAFLVDSLPILRHIPDWVPGISFKVRAKESRRLLHRLRDEPYDHVKRQVTQGTALPSITASVIANNSKPTWEEENVQKTATSILYAAGADTTTSAVASFVLIMTLYPEVQRKAQAELDSFVESGRLPTFTDRPKLPYVEALMKEVYRWNPVSPLALPHRVMEDDIYEGYHIPAGSTVIANTWAILHDPSLYPDPFEVIPERYLEQDANLNPDPRSFAFGYGRRVCPGQLLADNSLFIVMVMILSTMNISKASGPDGSSINIDVEYSGGSISHPGPFECNVAPRSADAARLITTATASGMNR